MELGEFRLERPLGVGGMGAVWQGTHRSGVPVALKFLRRVDDRRLARFETEVRATAALDHPAIARVFDYGRTSEPISVDAFPGSAAAVPADSPWFAMELCSEPILDRATTMQWADLHPLLITLLDALGHAHARGVLHRDLKLDNVMHATATDLRPGPKLVDFGIAWLAANATGTTEAIGTPRLMAPEQLQRKDGLYGPWTDIYGIGLIAWRIVTGRIPYPGLSGTDLLATILSQTPAWSEPRFPVPSGLRGWVERCIARAPEDRFRYTADALKALQEVAHAPRAQVVVSEPESVRLGTAGLALVGVRRPQFVGRRSERDALLGFVTRVREAGRPGAFAVEGPEGSGRGWLVDSVAEQAEREGLAHVVRVRFAPDVPASDSVTTGLRERFGIYDDDAFDAERQVAFWSGSPAIGAALGPALAKHEASDASWMAIAAAALHALTADRPVILVLHDPPRAMSPLVHRVLGLPAPVAVVWAGGTLSEESFEPVSIDRCTLEDMPLSELRQLAMALVPLSPDAARRAADTADGSPALLCALLQHWAQQGWLETGPDGCRVASHAAPPPTAAVLAQTRLAALEQGLEVGDALEVAAALGPTVPEALWRELSSGDVDVLLERLYARGFVRATTDGFRFVQTAFLEAVRRTACDLPGQHGRIADCLIARDGPPEAIGHHLLEAGRTHEALVPLLEGVIPTADRSGPEAALLLLDRIEAVARTLPSERDRRWWACAVADRRANYRKSTDVLGAWSAARTALDLVRGLDDRDLEALVHGRFGALAVREGDERGAAEAYARALSREETVAPYRLAYWHSERGRALIALGEAQGGLYHLRQAWRCAMADPNHEAGWFEPLNAALWAEADGRMDDALHHCDRLELRALHLGSLVGRFHAARTRANVLRRLGEPDDALRGYADAVRLGRMLAYTHHVGTDTTRMVVLALERAQLDVATRAFDAVRDLLPPGRDTLAVFDRLHRCGAAVETTRRGWSRVRYHLDRCRPQTPDDPDAAAVLSWTVQALREARQGELAKIASRIERRSGDRRPPR